nr:unnamed protein product [Callosobruchus analis]
MTATVLVQLLGYMYVYLNWGTITVGDICSVLEVYVQCANNLIVIYFMYLNLDTLKRIIQHLQSEIFQPKSKRYIDIAEDLKKTGDFVRKYFILTSSAVTILVPLIKLLGKNLLYLTYIPPWMNFASLFIFQEICSIYSVVFCCSSVTLHANLMLEIGIQIDIMKHDLENNEDINVIFQSIKFYEEILRLSAKVQQIFKIGLSAIFFTGISVLCTTLFKLMSVTREELIFMGPYSLGITMILFVHCWFGNELIYKSDGITQSIFCSNWIGSNIKTQRVLLLFVTFTRRPVEMKLGGGLFTMSVPLFVSLLGYMYVYIKWDTITVSDISSVLFVYIQCFNNMTVISCIFCNMETLQSIIGQLQSEVFRPKSKKHVDIAKQLKKSGDLIRRYCFVTCFSIIFLYPLTKLLGKNRQLLYTAYTPSWISFTNLFVFQEIVTIYSVFICSSYLTLDANLMIEIAIQIEIMKDTLESNTDISLIFGYIKYFDEILRLSGRVQHIFSIGISVYFVTGILVVCTTLFRIMEVTIDELVFLLPYFTAIILILFIHCWFGNELIYRSQGITESIFCSNWIGSNLVTQRVLLMFMTFTKRPLKIKLGGGVFTMSIPLFVSLCRTAYSYLTLLQKFEQ